MVNVNELKAQKGDLLAIAEGMLATAKQSGKDIQGEQLNQYNTVVASIKALNADIERIESLNPEAYRRTPGIVPVAGVPGLSANKGRTGLSSSSVRELYNRSSRQEQSQLDSLAAYLTGNISAAADLTPSGDGGVLIPTFVLPALERDYAAFAPVVSQARIWGTDTGEPGVFPVLSDSESAVQLAPAASTGADATVSGDTPPTDLTGPTLGAWKVSSKPVFIPRETFTDSAIDIVGEVIGALLARIIRFENLKYTKGAGTTECEGFLLNATKLVTGAVALDLDICLDASYNVPQLYRAGGVYMMTDTTAKYLRKLKTGISGDKRQLWADADATKGTPPTLHGYPVIINNDMDSVSSDGTFSGKNPLAFGNFSKFVVRQAEYGSPFLYRYQVPAKDGGAVILFRRSDSKLLIPTAMTKVAVS